MAEKFIRKKHETDEKYDAPRSIYFAKKQAKARTKYGQQKEVQSEQDFSENAYYEKSEFSSSVELDDDLTLNTLDDISPDSDRAEYLRYLIETEKQSLEHVAELIKKQSISVEIARKNLHEKQLMLDQELRKPSNVISTSEQITISEKLSSKVAPIKNPMTVVKAHIELMKVRRARNEDEVMLDSLTRMEHVLNGITEDIVDLLGFVRKSPVSYSRQPIQQIFKNALARLTFPSNIQVEVTDENPMVFCDSDKLERAISFLIQNSIDVLGTSGGKVLLYSTDESDKFIIDVADSGPGIAEENLDKIFEPMFTTKRQNVGLGLTMAKQIVEEHKGIITVSNNPTIFSISLPQNVDKVLSE